MKRSYGILIGILVLALIPRAVMLMRIAPGDFYASSWYAGEGGDAAEYSAIAVNLAEKRGFSLEGRVTNLRPPLYPFFLAVLYKFFGNENLTAVRIAQIMLALAALALFWSLARHLTASFWTAYLAMLVLAIHPRFITYNLVLLTETIFFALILTVLWCAVCWHHTKKPAWLALAMSALALAALTRPTALYFFPFLLLWVWRVVQKKELQPVKSFLSLAAPGVMLFTALTGMWVVRNYVQFHTFTFSNKSGGGLAEAWDRTILEPLGISHRDILSPYQHLSEEEFAKTGYKLFFTEIRDHPLLIAKITALKFLYWFNPFVKSSSASFRALYALGTSAIFVLGAWGLWLFWKKRGGELPMLFLLLMTVFTVMHVLTVPYHRYRFPVIDPYMILFAAYALCEFMEMRRKRAIPSMSVAKNHFL